MAATLQRAANCGLQWPLTEGVSDKQLSERLFPSKTSFRSKHEAELAIFEAAKSTLLAMQGDEKLPSLKSLQAEQQRLYDERAKLKKEAKMIDTMKANVDDFLKPNMVQETEQKRGNQRE